MPNMLTITDPDSNLNWIQCFGESLKEMHTAVEAAERMEAIWSALNASTPPYYTPTYSGRDEVRKKQETIQTSLQRMYKLSWDRNEVPGDQNEAQYKASALKALTQGLEKISKTPLIHNIQVGPGPLSTPRHGRFPGLLDAFKGKAEAAERVAATYE